MSFHKSKYIATAATALFVTAGILAFDAPKTIGEGAQALYWFETTSAGTPTTYIGNMPSGDCPDAGTNSCERAYLESQTEVDGNGERQVVSGQENQFQDQINKP